MSDEDVELWVPDGPSALVWPEPEVHDHAPGPDYGTFGPCAHCATDAVVKVNGKPMCIPHMNEEFAGISELTRRIAANIAAQQEEEA